MLIPVFFDSSSKLDEKGSSQLDAFISKLNEIPASNFPSELKGKFPAMRSSENDAKLWGDLSGDATEDFHPFVQQIASCVKKEPKSLRFAHPVKLSNQSLISQVTSGKQRRFQFQLGVQASKRCGKKQLSIQLLAPSLYAFASGMAILLLEWEYLESDNKPVSAADIIEGNYVISHLVREKKKAPSVKDETNRNEIPFESADFIALAKSLLPSNLADKISPSRRILYTALRIAPNDSHADSAGTALLAHRLSHRQTFDYQPDTAQVASGQLCPFANVRHAAAIEGGCTLVVADENSPEHLRNLINDRVRNTYLPLALVSFHAYFWLVTQTQELPDSSRAQDAHQEKESLDSLQERVLNFRRVFHFPIASQISQQNEFHKLWQSTLMIDRQLDVLTNISELAATKAQERRVKLIGYLSGGAGGFLLGKEFIEVLRNKFVMNSYEWQSQLFSAFLNHDAVSM